MVEFGLCPRCGGDLHRGGDYYGEYRNCLQCGNVIYVEPAKKHVYRAPGPAKAGRPRELRGSDAA